MKNVQAQVTREVSPGVIPSRALKQFPSNAAKFALSQGFRPSAGAALFAHTEAFLTLSGMYAGATLPRSTVVRFMGETAVKHHLNSTGFFAQDVLGVHISAMGMDAFKLRTIDPEMLAGFTDILSTGKTARTMSATFTNPIGIKAV